MGKSYELFLHFKQGDDFGQILQANNNDIPTALRVWEQGFKENAAVCARLAKAFEGQALTAHADTHHISFAPDDAKADECLEVMVKEELLQAIDSDDEDDDADER